MARKFTFVRTCTPEQWSPLKRTYNEGDVVFEWADHDYGCARDDLKYGGVHSVCCTNIKDVGPFFTVPIGLLKDEAGNEPDAAYFTSKPSSKLPPGME